MFSKRSIFLLGVRSHYRVVKDQPKGKILDSTHFKASADEKINKAQNIISVLAKMVKIVRKGEMLASSLPFPKMFSKVVKTRNWWALKSENVFARYSLTGFSMRVKKCT